MPRHLDKACRCRVADCRKRTKVAHAVPFTTRCVRICADHWQRFKSGEALVLKPWAKPVVDSRLGNGMGVVRA